MFFPIGDTNIEKGSRPHLTYLLIIINIAVFLFEFSLPSQTQAAFIFEYGSIPVEITQGIDLYTLFTCMFLHGSWMHLIGNMVFLWVFGDNIEATIGSFKYLLFYLGGGLAASLMHTIMNPLSNMPCVGASGAIAACLGAYIIMFPHSKIRVLFILFFTTFSVPAIFFLGFWIIQQFMSGMGSLSTATTDSAGVAYWAHIGGFVFGVLFGMLFRGKAKTMVMRSV